MCVRTESRSLAVLLVAFFSFESLQYGVDMNMNVGAIMAVHRVAPFRPRIARNLWISRMNNDHRIVGS